MLPGGVAPGQLVLTRGLVRFTYQGTGLPSQAGWPFIRIVVGPRALDVRLFRTTVSLAPDDIATLQEYSQRHAFGAPVAEHGVAISLRSALPTSRRLAITGMELSFGKQLPQALQALTANGFTVQPPVVRP